MTKNLHRHTGPWLHHVTPSHFLHVDKVRTQGEEGLGEGVLEGAQGSVGRSFHVSSERTEQMQEGGGSGKAGRWLSWGNWTELKLRSLSDETRNVFKVTRTSPVAPT